jgi:hypothetical protein
VAPIGSGLASNNSFDAGAHEPGSAASFPFGIQKAATDPVRFAKFGVGPGGLVVNDTLLDGPVLVWR